MKNLEKETDSTVLSMMYTRHAEIEKLQRELEQLKIEAERRKLM
jgi:hypothetical protein